MGRSLGGSQQHSRALCRLQRSQTETRRSECDFCTLGRGGVGCGVGWCLRHDSLSLAGRVFLRQVHPQASTVCQAQRLAGRGGSQMENRKRFRWN